MKFAEYVVWILFFMHCSFGEKIYYSSRDIEFFLGGYFFYGAPCTIGTWMEKEGTKVHWQ